MTAAALLTGLALYPGAALYNWGLGDIQASPALAVCSVERVVKLGPVPPRLSWSPWPQHYYEARVLVQRVFFNAADRPFEPGDRIAVRYHTDDPITGGGGGGGGVGPPFFLDLHQGQIALFSLKPAKALKPSMLRWALVSIGDKSTVLPAYLAEPGFGDPPRTGRTFILRELTNALTHGSAAERSRAAAFFMGRSDTIPPELPRLIRAALGANDDAWLETGCAFLGVYGGPRNNPELVYGEASPPFHNIRELVTWILWKGDRRDYPNRLIRRLLRNSPDYAWGAANTLVDFKDSTVLIDELNSRLRRGMRGSMTVAWFIAIASWNGRPHGSILSARLIRTPIRTFLEQVARLLRMMAN